MTAQKLNKVIATAPATIANVGPGFDVLGFALAEPHVTVEVAFGDAEGNNILIECDREGIPTDPNRNTAGAAAQALMANHGNGEDLVIEIKADIPVGSGLGSSAASAVAAVLALNELLGCPVARDQLLPFAIAGEAVASGTPHADNVAPALFGGLTLVRSHEPVDWVHLSTPDNLHTVVVHPACAVETAEARHALDDTIRLDAGVRQWAQVGALVAGFCQGNLPLIGRALDDQLIEPVRGQFIPGYTSVKQAAKDAGALGCAIAGSGPSMFSFCADAATAKRVEFAMRDAFGAAEIECESWIGHIARDGAAILNAS